VENAEGGIEVIDGANPGQSRSWGQSLATMASRVRADVVFAFLDVFVVVASYTIGMGLRMLDPAVTQRGEYWSEFAIAIPFIVLLYLLANVFVGAYGHVWEYASTNEAIRVVVGSAAATALVFGVSWAGRWLIGLELIVPYAVIVIGGLLSLFAMGMVRFRSRLFSFHRGSGAMRTLIVGVGRDAVAFSRIAPQLDGGRVVVGFVSDEVANVSPQRRLAGLEVLGSVSKIPELVEDLAIGEIVVVGGDSEAARKVVDLCLDVDARLRMLPSAEDVVRDGVAAIDVRDIRVEDLLIRQPIQTDLSALEALITGRHVMVTGAGGSIGSEIVKQVLEFGARSVCALDRDETLLHDASLRWPRSDVTHPVLGDVRDAERMIRLFEQATPEIVFHAAALKHVPVLESNPSEAVLTNVIGTRNVIEAASRVGAKRFVLISTDKAVDPTSVMGATKRVAEIMTQVGSERADDCIFTAVRFGNVLGSRGSVIPTFVEQIKNKGPVTVTHPDMTRYFMTVDEAVQLVLQASAMATGSEVFLLDMGDPVRIQDLARRLIRLAGLSPERDIKIEFTGRRPGEKLEEVLSSEPLESTSNDKVNEVKLNHPRASYLMKMVSTLESAAVAGDQAAVRALLNDLVGGGLDTDDVVVDISRPTEAVGWS